MAIYPQQFTIYLYSAHRAVIFAIAQLSCFTSMAKSATYINTQSCHVLYIADFRGIKLANKLIASFIKDAADGKLKAKNTDTL